VVRAPKYWPNGSTLRVRLLGGTPAQHEAVRRHACEWTDYANLKLEYSTAIDAEIRVAFDPDGGSWSYEGTDAREVPLEFPTMNLASPDRATILHQFGRAIGLGPEHQNPAGGIAWNVPAVIRDLSGPPNYWDPETVEHQFLEKYAVDHVNGSAFDPQSIMVLPIPPEWTLNGAATTRNETLSWRDKELVKQIYPPPGVIGADPGRR
jgi:hypothetical protein